MLTIKQARAAALRAIGDHGASRRPFELGFLHGLDHGFASRREVPHGFNADQAERYLNGRDDGANRDTTRITMRAIDAYSPRMLDAAAAAE